MVITCPQCGARNRVAVDRAKALEPVCGKCHAKLDVNASNGDGHPIEVTDETFKRDVLGADKPVLVDCWAAWCGPCRMIAPTIDQLAAESNGRYVVAKLDIDNNQQTAGRYTISSIPTMLIFKNGELVDKLVGLQPKQAIEAKLNAFI